MKLNLLALFVLTSFFSVAQIQFDEAIPSIHDLPFDTISASTIKFADVDGDSDQDIIMIGESSSSSIAKLYLNNGDGNFTEKINTPFQPVNSGVVDFVDVNGDFSPDVFITGSHTAKLYTNDGLGNFIEQTGTPFTGVRFSSFDFADIDGDNDQDVIITGEYAVNNYLTKLYTNNGAGVFTEVTSTSFQSVWMGSSEFADIDGDNDQDLLITGWNNSGDRVADLFENDGNGNFILISSNFIEVAVSTVNFIDVDSDNDKDVFITGNYSTGYQSKLYKNDGNGVFTEQVGTPFDGIEDGHVEFADIDGDNDLDVLIAGTAGPSQSIAELFLNDGTGSFTLSPISYFEGIISGSFDFADIDGDQDQDIMITGENESNTKITKLYQNDGNGVFREQTGHFFPQVWSSTMDYSDIDGDGDLDLVIAGELENGEKATQIYRNNGSGGFNEILSSSIIDVDLGSVKFFDIDEDTDNDMVISGRDNTNQAVIKFYQNDGSGNFTEISNSSVESVRVCDIDFSDIDNDGDFDLLIAGSNNSNQLSTKLYENDGSGSFTEVVGTSFENVSGATVNFIDFDNDNDEDVFITGHMITECVSKLYENDASGNFAEVVNTPFAEIKHGDVDFADIDGDQNFELVLLGEDIYSQKVTKLYSMVGGNFIEKPSFSSSVFSFGSIDFFDAEGDGDQDLLICGEDENLEINTKLFLNDGNGNLIEYGNVIEQVWAGHTSVFDVDGDNDKDIVISGENENGAKISKLYINNSNPFIFNSNESFTIKEEVVLSPNPTKGVLNIQWNMNPGKSQYKVFDISGKIILEWTSSAQKESLDISHFENGVYIVSVKSEKVKQKFKIVKR